MSRRARNTRTVELFPFLAVLVCMMGALILMLLVTTRQMRRQVLLAAARQAEPPPVAAAPAGPDPAEAAAARARRAAEREALRAAYEASRTAAESERSAQEETWRRQLSLLAARRDEIEAELERRRADRDRQAGALQATAEEVNGLQRRVAQAVARQTGAAEQADQLKAEHAELQQDIAFALGRVKELQESHAAAQSQFAFIPYDGALGTTRRPIFIECTGDGLRFMPEDEKLSVERLVGFTEQYNPLLLGTRSLILYWQGHADLKPDKPERSEPYVLLLVRPSGSKEYYIARQLLTYLGQPFGYELIQEDYPLYLPPADPQAKLLLKQALDQAFRERQDIIRSLARRGEGGRPIELEDFEGFEDGDGSGRRGSGAGTGSGFGSEPTGADAPGSAPARLSGGGSGASAGTSVGTRPGRELGGFAGGGGTGRRGAGRGGRVADAGDAPFADIGLGGGSRNGAGGGDSASGNPFDPASDGARGSRGGDALGEAQDPTQPGSRNAGGGTRGGASGASRSGAEQAGGASRGTGSNGAGPDGRGTGARGGAQPRDTTAQSGAAAGGTPGRGTKPRGSQRNPQGPTGATDGEPSELGLGYATDGKLEHDATQTAAQPSGTSRPRGGTAPRGGNSSRGTERFSAAGGSASGAGGSATSSGAGASAGSRGGSDVEGAGPPSVVNVDMGRKNRKPTGKEHISRQRWGFSRGNIGFERVVNIVVTPQQIVIGDNDVTLAVGRGESRDELAKQVLGGLDVVTARWGDPPANFYWIPTVKFLVYPGGNQHYERLHGPLRQWGVFSEVEFAVEARAPTVQR